MSVLSRRQFVVGAGAAGLGVVAGCGRLPGQGQPAARGARIGFLSVISRQANAANVEALLLGLADYGYAEGRNLTIEWRFADSTVERVPALAAELTALPVDVIAASGATAIHAAMNATTTIPIVMTQAGIDPVAAGLVASYARPGGNVTGVTAIYNELSGKRLELLKESVPSIARVAVLWNAANPDKPLEAEATRVAAQVLGIQVQPLEVRSLGDFEGAFAAAITEHADGLVVFQDRLTNTSFWCEIAATRRSGA